MRHIKRRQWLKPIFWLPDAERWTFVSLSADGLAGSGHPTTYTERRKRRIGADDILIHFQSSLKWVTQTGFLIGRISIWKEPTISLLPFQQDHPRKQILKKLKMTLCWVGLRVDSLKNFRNFWSAPILSVYSTSAYTSAAFHICRPRSTKRINWRDGHWQRKQTVSI